MCKKTAQIIERIIFILCILIIISSGSQLNTGAAYAANYPLEIINIKPAGTGSPVIPSTNRIFRAYPGIEYNIRAAIIGGTYPFTYVLNNAPAGMTINSNTGEISWPNPQSNSGVITLSVTDSEKTTVTTSWTITVSTTGFYFVDSSKTINGNGTINSPFNSIANMVAGTGSSRLNDIVYFRGGNHSLPVTGTSCGGVCNATILTNNAPFTWLGYPGETVNISGNGTTEIRTYKIWYDSLNFSGFNYHGIEGQGGANYQTIRRCKFSNIVASNATNLNQGFIYLNSDTTNGFYSVIQDNEFSNFTGACAIGSLYSMSKSLIEDNYIHDPGGPGLTGISSAIAPKDLIEYMFIRHNRVVTGGKAYALGNAMNSIMAYTNHMDISFNYFNVTDSLVAHEFFERADKPQTNIYYYRNTLVGHLGFDRIDGSNCASIGVAKIYNNVIINNNLTPKYIGGNTSLYIYNKLAYHNTLSSNAPHNCVIDTNNLKGAISDNIIDANGNLTSAYQNYLGLRGWETGSGSVISPTKIRSFTVCDDAGKCTTITVP